MVNLHERVFRQEAIDASRSRRFQETDDRDGKMFGLGSALCSLTGSVILLVTTVSIWTFFVIS